MTKAILDGALFKLALGYAKAIAKSRNESELTPATFLCGIVIALNEADDSDDAQLVTSKLDAIKAALAACSMAIHSEPIEAVTEKMPLSAVMRDALSNCGTDLGLFIDSLVEKVAPVAITDNPLVAIIVPYLADYLEAKDAAEVDGDSFAAAAFSAFENGEFRSFPGLTSFFSTNQPYLVALVGKRFAGLRSRKRDVASLPKLSSELQSELREQKDGSNARFIAAFDLGLTTGLDAVSDRETAYHEAGHAIVSSVLRPEIPINRILVKREEGYLGVTVPDPTSPHFDRRRRQDYLADLCVLLAGQAAQALKFGQGSMDEGASSDISKATQRAWISIAQFGLDPEFGPIDLSVLDTKTGWIFDEAQRRLQAVMKEAATRTDTILSENWIKLEVIATALIERGEVDFEQFVSGLTLEGLQSVTGAVRVENVAITRNVTFADQSGSHETPEGVVQFEAGDALVSGEDGESWPIARKTFDQLYSPSVDVKLGSDGAYQKHPRIGWALPLKENTRVDLSAGRGVLLGQGGDWIVDYGNGDMAIVSGLIFAKLYRIVG